MTTISLATLLGLALLLSVAMSALLTSVRLSMASIGPLLLLWRLLLLASRTSTCSAQTGCPRNAIDWTTGLRSTRGRKIGGVGISTAIGRGSVVLRGWLLLLRLLLLLVGRQVSVDWGLRVDHRHSDQQEYKVQLEVESKRDQTDETIQRMATLAVPSF